MLKTKDFLQNAQQVNIQPYYLAFLIAKEKGDPSLDLDGFIGSEYIVWITKRWSELNKKLGFSTSIMDKTPLSETRFDNLKIMWLVKYLNNLERSTGG
jgi:hypothetical protein